MKTFHWDPPRSAPIGDHDVPEMSAHQRGKRVALLVCGGIAAMKTPLLARALRRRGAEAEVNPPAVMAIPVSPVSSTPFF